MPMPFELVLDGPPVSLQARTSAVRNWRDIVRGAAVRRWNNEPPFAGEVTVTITYLFDSVNSASPDVDNIPKPILDALKELVYLDDRQVTDLLCRKRELHGNLRIQNATPLLLQSFASSQSILHIVVAESMGQEVAL